MQTKVAGMAPADLDPLVDLVQEIADFFNGGSPGGRRERLIARQHDPLFDQQHLAPYASCLASTSRIRCMHVLLICYIAR